MVEERYRAKWSCPSNIALVKYWGKRPGQLPINPSFSFSLQKSRTETSVSIQKSSKPEISFLFEGKESPFGERVRKYLELLKLDYPWMQNYSFLIESENTFPHSAGIASSASSFGALALCLTDLSMKVQEVTVDEKVFSETASRMARAGSGSACRSIYSGFALWGKSGQVEGTTDRNAIPFREKIHPQFQGLMDAVLLVDSGKKQVSSSSGHELMNQHPFKENRVAQANQNLKTILESMKSGDVKTFFEIVENEALTLHALMMSSSPSVVLLKAESLIIIEKIRTFRQQTDTPVGFTIDAGPNIHLLYFKENRTQVRDFIQTELTGLLENEQWMDDRIGEGPEKLE
ncbi:diphosphomevalonate decarboxylase [Sunxiuqinia sp. A32]|uniref:diphosphomevalonate decarboxylase n=1 Tax=Sunxiuqinia sp. A32 TaxID=3461496 RepID=UPI00404673B7